MKRMRGCLMVAFIFTCGFLVGGFLGAAIGSVGFFHKIVKGGPGAIRGVVMERASNDLRLKPVQKERIREIVDETGAALVAATAAVWPKLEEIMGRGEDQIRGTLDPKQRKKFDGLVNQARVHWKATPDLPTVPVAPVLEDAPSSKTGHPDRSGSGKVDGVESNDL